MKYILTTNDLTKNYKKHCAADKINIHVKKGEIYGLIGRNGAGKTTILRMISGLSNASSGSYSINGKTNAELVKEKKKVGALIEAPGIYPNMTAYENIKIKCIALGKNNDEYIESMLKIVGLDKAKNKKTREFSLGMRQRLGIALALVGDPELIILDEPINGLDPQGIAEMREILLKLSKEQGITIIISSHILDELSKIADSYGIIHKGKLIDEMTTQQLNDRCSEFIGLKTNDNQKAVQLLKEMGVVQLTTDNNAIKIKNSNLCNEEIVDRLVKHGVKISEIYSNRLTLEEYYLNMTGGNKND